MKTIIAGSRTAEQVHLHRALMKCKWTDQITEVVCGEAKGADRLGKRWALDERLSVRSFPADWNKWGKAAGPKRNVEMAMYAQACIAVWDGESRGTHHMITEARDRGLRLFVYNYGTGLFLHYAQSTPF